MIADSGRGSVPPAWCSSTPSGTDSESITPSDIWRSALPGWPPYGL